MAPLLVAFAPDVWYNPARKGGAEFVGTVRPVQWDKLVNPAFRASHRRSKKSPLSGGGTFLDNIETIGEIARSLKARRGAALRAFVKGENFTKSKG